MAENESDPVPQEVPKPPDATPSERLIAAAAKARTLDPGRENIAGGCVEA